MNVGIVGGGQLARMLALAGYPLDLRFQVLDPASDACAGQVAALLRGDYDQETRLEALADWADVVTFDFENVPAEAAHTLERQVAVYPPAQALALAQDRLLEKTLFWELGIPTPAFTTVASLKELQAAIERVGLPAMLKTRRLGYDGKGQYLLREAADADAAWRGLGGVPLLLESFIPFEREVSVLAAAAAMGPRPVTRWWKITIAMAFCACRGHRWPHRNWRARLELCPPSARPPALCWPADSGILRPRWPPDRQRDGATGA